MGTSGRKTSPAPFALTAVGLLVMLLGLSRVVAYRASNSWPSVKGTITHSRIVGWTQGEPVEGKKYVPKVRYSYEVDGEDYTGSRIAFASKVTRSYDEATAMADKYMLGNMVDVYYSPKHPGTAILEAGYPGSVRLVALAGLLVAAAGGVMWLKQARQSAAPSSPPPDLKAD